MLNVFVISSDKRVDSLIEHFQPFFKSKIRCASDFDNGLKEVFENRPTVVFIQSTIGTVSGETVSRHIKSLLGSESPRIVFMGDIDNTGKKGASWCDDWICVSDSAQQLQQDFAELISRNFPQDWQEIYKEMGKTVSSSADTAQTATCFGTESVLQQGGADDSGFALSGEAEGVSVPEKSGFTGADSVGLDRDLVEEESFSVYQNFSDDPFLENFAAPSKRRFVWKLVTGFFLLAIAVSGLCFLLLRTSDNPLPASAPSAALSKADAERPVSQPENSKGGIKGLPAFVHSEWRDVPYTLQHPGWERYVSPEIEFRIFREKGVIKALQGISRDQNGISEAFLGQILDQLGFNKPLPIGKEILENEFLVKSILFPGVAEIVTYQEQRGAKTKAFVLEFF